MKKPLILTTVMAFAIGAGAVFADSDDGANHGVRHGDDASYSHRAPSGVSRLLHWITGDSDHDGARGYRDDDSDDGYRAAGNTPRPSTPPANGLFGSGTPTARTN